MRFAGVALAVFLLLAGCGGGEEPKAAPTTEATAPPLTVAAPKGVPALGDLSNLQCRANTEGVWSAVGILKNSAEKSASYTVTAFVGAADGQAAKALSKDVQNVAPGGSIKIVLAEIPADDEATQCFVRVLRQ